MAALATTLLAAGCTGGRADGSSPATTAHTSKPASTPSEVRWRGDGQFGVKITAARPGRRWSEGFVLCVTGPTPAQVTGFRFAKGSGVRIHRYAVRLVDPERSDYLGSHAGTLESLKLHPTAGASRQVSARCGAEGLHSELGLEVSLASGQPAHVSDLRVRYQSGSRRGEVAIPIELEFCQRGASESFCD